MKIARVGILGFAIMAALLLMLCATGARSQCNEQVGSAAEFKGSTDYRNLVAGLVGQVPQVGSAVSQLTLLLWPDNSQQELFQAMVDYVNQIVPGMIAQEHILLLEQNVQGLKKLVKDYDRTINPMQKGEYLTDLIGHLDVLEPQFFDERLPERTLAPLVAFGTLRLVALREQYLYSNLYYGYGTDPDRLTHYEELKETAARYVAATSSMRQRLLDARMAKIHTDIRDNRVRLPPNRRDPELNGVVYDKVGTYHDDFCGTNKVVTIEHEDPFGGEKRWDEWNTLCKQGPIRAKKAYEASLDLILAPAHDWPKLVPPAPASPRS